MTFGRTKCIFGGLSVLERKEQVYSKTIESVTGGLVNTGRRK